MIKYNPNSWIKLIFHRYSRKTFKKTLPNMVSISVYSFLLTYLIETYALEYFAFGSGVHSLLGVVLGLFLVFRTNTAYDKWWEGRKIWGAMVNDCRNLSLKLNAFLKPEDEHNRSDFATLIASYVTTMKDHLRDDVKLENTKLNTEDKEKAKKWDHKPNYIASRIYNLINELYKKEEISGDQLFILDKEVKGLTDHIGACERIKNTPIPYSYSMYIKKFIFIYSVTLPLGLVANFHYWTVAVVAYVFYFLITIELIAEEIEEPFGHDENDLPTDELSVKIGDNVREILFDS